MPEQAPGWLPLGLGLDVSFEHLCLLLAHHFTDDERKSRYYLTRGESADPSEKFTDSFEDSVSETYHFYHSLHPPNDGSSNEALPEYSEVGPQDIQIYATPEGCSPTLLHPPTIVVVQHEEEEEAVDGTAAQRNVCCMTSLCIRIS